MTDQERFREHLKEARRVVSTWPKWKQTLLGGNPIPREESKDESPESTDEDDSD